jgi:hypothetical protein
MAETNNAELVQTASPAIQCPRWAGGVADDDLRAQADTHEKAGDNQPADGWYHRTGEGGQAEDQQVDLVGEAPAEVVAENACDPGAQHHAEEGGRDELAVVGHVRPAAFDHCAEDAAAKVDLERVKEHSGTDQG